MITMLSDGNSEIFNNLVSMNIYGDDCELTKEELQSVQHSLA